MEKQIRKSKNLTDFFTQLNNKYLQGCHELNVFRGNPDTCLLATLYLRKNGDSFRVDRQRSTLHQELLGDADAIPGLRGGHVSGGKSVQAQEVAVHGASQLGPQTPRLALRNGAETPLGGEADSPSQRRVHEAVAGKQTIHLQQEAQRRILHWGVLNVIKGQEKA